MLMKIEDGGGEFEIERAHSVEIAGCGDPECGHPHLLLLRENGTPIAQAVLPRAIIKSLSDWFSENGR